MGIFKRVGDIFSANLNDLVDRFEDPEKMMKQAIREMEDAVRAAVSGVAGAIASERRLERELDANRRGAGEWRGRARRAVVGEDDDRARRALARALEHESIAAALDEELERTRATNAALRRRLDAMRAKLAQARRTLSSLTARRRIAAARRKVLDGLDPACVEGPAFGRFERMRERVEHAEAEADARAELASEEPEDAADALLEEELAALRREVGACSS